MRTCLFILALLTASTGFSQNKLEDTSANYRANWKIGESKIFYILHHKESYESGKQKSNFDFSYVAYVSIIDSSENGYTVQWVFHLPKKIKEANSGLADSLPVFAGMEMIFKTSENGEFKGLINWKEVKDAYIRMMEISFPKNIDSTSKANLAQTKALFNSQKVVESTLIKEIQLFYLPYGHTFTTKEIREPVQLPNPFTDKPLPAYETYQITEYNPKQNNFTLVIKQDLDKSGTQDVIEGAFKKFGLDKDSAILEARNFTKTLVIKDYSEYQFNSSMGWPTKIKYERTMKNAQITQTDAYIIEMKEP